MDYLRNRWEIRSLYEFYYLENVHEERYSGDSSKVPVSSPSIRHSLTHMRRERES